MNRRFSHFLVLLAVNAFVLGLFALAAEAGLRMFTPPDLAFKMKGREFVRWTSTHTSAESIETPYGLLKRLKKNFSLHVDYPGMASYDVRTGPEGFRTRYVAPQKDKILAIGDSLTFGYWVNEEESWPYLVGEQVEKEYPHLQVVNVATPGHSTWDQIIVLRELVPRYRPPWVVLGFSVGNDYIDNYRDRELGRMLGVEIGEAMGKVSQQNDWLQRLYDFQYHPWFRKVRWHLKWHSYFLNFLWLRLSPTGVAQNYWTFTDPPTAKFLKGVELTRRAFWYLRDFLADYDTRLLVVILPTKEQIDFEYYEEDYQRRWWLAGLIGYHFPPREKLPWYSRIAQKMLAKAGIETIDLYEDFMRHRGEKLFFPNDFHPTARGYRLIADRVAGYLLRHLPREEQA